MARADGLYSRVIAWLKILLPLAALVLLSTLFLLSRDREEALDMPFADALARGETAREEIGAPYYAGTTDRGDALTMTARAARPEEDGAIRADAFEATLSLTDGSTIRLDSGEALLRNAADEVTLDGGVRIESSTGYVLDTQRMVAATDSVAAETEGPVRGVGPVGTLEAGRMRIVPDGTDGDVQLLFTDGVKLIYEPQKE